MGGAARGQGPRPPRAAEPAGRGPARWLGRGAPLRPPVLPEPARAGEDPADCRACTARNEGIWLDDIWRLTSIGNAGVRLVLMPHQRDQYDLADLPDERAAELGVLTTHVVRH